MPGLLVRPRALSLAAAKQTLYKLPTELILDILELSLVQCKPTTLAVTSQAICALVETILYSNITLDSPQSISLFHRTISAKSASFLSSHVRNISITCSPTPMSQTAAQIWDILAACGGLQSVIIPSGFHPDSISAIVNHLQDTLCALTLENYDALDQYGRCASLHYLPSSSALFPVSLTHLRICEPSLNSWYSPATILDAFGSTPSLTHLQLSRRANSNEDNDIIFVDEVADILAYRPSLKMLVVSIFAQHAALEGGSDVQASTIWTLLSAVAEDDPRLVVIPGTYGAWRKEWSAQSALVKRNVDYWSSVQVSEA